MFDILYQEVERVIMPTLVGMARRFAPRIDMPVEDVIQEGRLSLFAAFRSYDFNRSRGNIHAYANEVLRNSMRALVYQALAQSRINHVVTRDEAGNSIVTRSRPVPVGDGIYEIPSQSHQYDILEGVHLNKRLAALRDNMIKRLCRRPRPNGNSANLHKDVFECMCQPSNRFLSYMRNVGASEANNGVIAAYLMVSKNAIDWSMHVIKSVFTELMEAEFSDLVDVGVLEGQWPMIYSTNRDHDSDMIARTMLNRQLDPRPVAPLKAVRMGHSERIIEDYAWGSILYLRHNGKCATVLVEGRFNAITGEVIAPHGYWKSIAVDVPWYQELNASLRPKARKATA